MRPAARTDVDLLDSHDISIPLTRISEYVHWLRYEIAEVGRYQAALRRVYAVHTCDRNRASSQGQLATSGGYFWVLTHYAVSSRNLKS